MTTHVLAKSLRQLADEIEQKPDTPFEKFGGEFRIWSSIMSREEFVSFARTMRNLKKEFDSDEYRLVFGSGAVKLEARAYRDQVCTLIRPAQPAVYECESLLDKELEEIQ